MVNATNQTWLNGLWDQVVTTPVGGSDYYGNTLKLLSMLVLSGNWWAPESVTGGCVPDATPFCTAGGTLAETQLRLQKIGGTTARAIRANGWKVTPKVALYRNKSGAADPPACTVGSAQGLVKLKLAPQGAHDVAVQAITKRSTLGAFVGPLRATVVLGDSPAAGAAGDCGVSTPLVCAGSVTLRCEEAGS